MTHIVKALLVIIILIGGAIGYIYSINFTRLYPVNYIFAPDTYQDINDLTEGTDILIIGDNFGQMLNERMAAITDATSKGLKEPLKIFNISIKNEGIHRTLKKIKMLKKVPPVVIYMGGTSEFYEDTYAKNIDKEMFNFNVFKNDYLQTLITIYPKLSRIFYMPQSPKVLTEKIDQHLGFKDTQTFQKITAKKFYLYQSQLTEMLDLILEANSTAIVVTPVINLQTPVNLVCDGAVTNDLTISQTAIKKLINEKKYKQAYNEALILEGVSVANAQTKYLLGLTQLNLGMYAKAEKNLTMAKGLDCAPAGAHPVINAIIRRVTNDRQVNIIDFDKQLNRELGKNELFINDTTPQFIYQEILEKRIIVKIKEAFEL
jgi:hypothetical protein